MKKSIYLLIFVLSIMFTNAQQTGQFTSSITWTNFAGSQTRAMTVYVPTDYNSSNTYKLIIGFHGLGDTHDNYIGALTPYATDSYYGNVIVVSLEYSDWDENLYDDGIVPETINHISSTYNIDPDNIYLQGFSVGGISSTYRGLKNSNLIKGIITNSGAMAGIADVENTCTTGACKNYDYNETANVFACFTSSPDYETGVCSGAADPCDVNNTFYAVNNAITDKFNNYTPNSAIFYDNPNNCHCLPTVEVNHQCWDFVSQEVSTTTPIANFTADITNIAQGESVTFTDASSEGGAAITSWQWSFQGGTPATYSGQNPPAITYNNVGTYEVSLTVTNSYGSDTKTITSYINVEPLCDLMSLDFEIPNDYSQIFKPWNNIDNDGKNTYSSSDCDFPNEGSAFSFMAFNPSDANFTLASTHGGQRCGMAICPSDASTADNWLISDKITLGTGAELKFWVLTPKPGSWGNESFNVLISTSTNNLNDFTAIATNEDAPSSWTQKIYDLSSYAGQDVYLAIQHVSTDKFMFWIDDIEITGGVTSIENKTINNIQIYPNPAKNIVTINNIKHSKIDIVDVFGKTLISKVSEDNDIKIDLSDLSEGTYFVKISNNNRSIVKKLVVE